MERRVETNYSSSENLFANTDTNNLLYKDLIF